MSHLQISQAAPCLLRRCFHVRLIEERQRGSFFQRSPGSLIRIPMHKMLQYLLQLFLPSYFSLPCLYPVVVREKRVHPFFARCNKLTRYVAPSPTHSSYLSSTGQFF